MTKPHTLHIDGALVIIEGAVGLHEDVNIIYVVDGYQVTISTMDGGRTIHRAEGKTIEAAMIALANWLIENDMGHWSKIRESIRK